MHYLCNCHFAYQNSVLAEAAVHADRTNASRPTWQPPASFPDTHGPPTMRHRRTRCRRTHVLSSERMNKPKSWPLALCSDTKNKHNVAFAGCFVDSLYQLLSLYRPCIRNINKAQSTLALPQTEQRTICLVTRAVSMPESCNRDTCTSRSLRMGSFVAMALHKTVLVVPQDLLMFLLGTLCSVVVPLRRRKNSESDKAF